MNPERHFADDDERQAVAWLGKYLAADREARTLMLAERRDAGRRPGDGLAVNLAIVDIFLSVFCALFQEGRKSLILAALQHDEPNEEGDE